MLGKSKAEVETMLSSQDTIELNLNEKRVRNNIDDRLRIIV